MTENSSSSPEHLQQATQVGSNLLDRFQWADLKVDDLKSGGVLAPHESFPDMLVRELRLGQDIIRAAWERLLISLPPPTDGGELNRVNVDEILSAEEIGQLRQYALGLSPTDEYPLGELREAAQSDAREFCSQIVTASLQPSDPLPPEVQDELPNPDDVIQRHGVEYLTSGFPTTIDLEGIGRCHSVIVGGGLFAPTLSSYLPATSREENAKLTDALSNYPKLLRYLLAEEVDSIQRQLVQELEGKFTNVALEKYPRLEKRVKGINAPVGIHFFDLLAQEVASKERLQLLHIFRDITDVAAVAGTAEPKSDRQSSESGTSTYTVTMQDQLTIRFDWMGREVRWQTDSSTTPPSLIMVSKDKPEVAFARKNSEGELEFGELRTDGTLRIISDDEYQGPAVTIRRLFSATDVVSLEDLKEGGEEVLKNARTNIDGLLRTSNLAEFFRELRYTSGYPTYEFLYNTTRGYPFVVGSFPPPTNIHRNN